MKKCSKCNEIKETYEFNRQTNKKDGLNNKCKICCSIDKKKWNDLNKEHKAAYAKEYYKKNRIALNNYRNNYHKERLINDDLYKLRKILRERINKAFKSNRNYKKPSTIKILGSDWIIAKKHIEQQFKKGMNWNNHGEWHIDHIIPLSSANTESELIKLCHYRNLQPLWAKDNLSKSSKIESVQTYIEI